MELEERAVSRGPVLAIALAVTLILLAGAGGLSRKAHADYARATVEVRAQWTAEAEAAVAAQATFAAASVVVGRVFENTDAIRIADGNQATSTLEVSGLMQGQIVDLKLGLGGFSHTYPDDVDIVLEAPNGKTVQVMSDAGGTTSVEDLDLTITDDASTLPNEGQLGNRSGAVEFGPADYNGDESDGSLPVSTEFGYNSSLYAFAGDDPNGTWKLYVWDDGDGDVGTIADGWELRLNVRVPRVD